MNTFFCKFTQCVGESFENPLGLIFDEVVAKT